jgi:hypothetical protein
MALRGLKVFLDLYDVRVAQAPEREVALIDPGLKAARAAVRVVPDEFNSKPAATAFNGGPDIAAAPAIDSIQEAIP